MQEQWSNSVVALAGELQRFMALPEVSPYDNPFAETGAREFQRLLERRVDFDSIAPILCGRRC